MGRFKQYLEEMAQDAHKSGYQFHLIHNGISDEIHAVVATHPTADKSVAMVNAGTSTIDLLPRDVGKRVVGFAEIQHAGGQYKDMPHNLYVAPEHRRKGVAAGLYNKYEQHVGRPVRPSLEQSDEAKSLWKDRRKS